MDIDQEINLMIQSVLARTGGRAKTIVCHRDALEQMRAQSTMFYTSDSDTPESGYVGRYIGIPVQVSDSIEPGRVYVIPEMNTTSDETSYVPQYWTTGPYRYYDHTHWEAAVDLKFGSKYTVCEEEKEIDEGSFMDILSCQNP